MDQKQPQQTDLTVDTAACKQVIELILQQIPQYIFSEVAARIETAIRQRLESGEYDSIENSSVLAKTLTTQLKDLSGDKHLEVFYSAEVLPFWKVGEPTPQDLERDRQYYSLINFGFQKLERLAGNVGYLELNGFVG